jgi:hypothetical protein
MKVTLKYIILLSICLVSISTCVQALPTTVTIEGTTVGVHDSTAPLITGTLATTTGFPLSNRIILLEASSSGIFPGTITSVVGKVVTNNDGIYQFRPSSLTQGPYYRAMYTGDGSYTGVKSEILDISPLLEEVKAARHIDGVGSINAMSTPSNADIYIDGVLYGKTDTIIKQIPSGEYTVTFVLDGYMNSTHPVLVSAQKTASLVVTLSKYSTNSVEDLFSISTQGMESVASISGGPASYQLYQNSSEPTAVPHSVDVITFSKAVPTSYLVIVSPKHW